MCVTVCNCVCVCAVFVFKAIHWKSLKDTHMCRHSDPVADSVWLLLKRPIPLQKEEMRGKRAARSCQTPPRLRLRPPCPTTFELKCGKRCAVKKGWSVCWAGQKVVMIQRWCAASGPGDTWCLQSNVERKENRTNLGREAENTDLFTSTERKSFHISAYVFTGWSKSVPAMTGNHQIFFFWSLEKSTIQLL